MKRLNLPEFSQGRTSISLLTNGDVVEHLHMQQETQSTLPTSPVLGDQPRVGHSGSGNGSIRSKLSRVFTWEPLSPSWDRAHILFFPKSSDKGFQILLHFKLFLYLTLSSESQVLYLCTYNTDVETETQRGKSLRVRQGQEAAVMCGNVSGLWAEAEFWLSYYQEKLVSDSYSPQIFTSGDSSSQEM
jgi:hypothetical protein